MPNFTMPLSQSFFANDAAVTVVGRHAQLQSGIDPNNARGSGRGDYKNPAGTGNPGIKAALAECILRSAAAGQTSYEALLASASEQIQFILSTMI
jgi:hypothetical protein